MRGLSHYGGGGDVTHFEHAWLMTLFQLRFCILNEDIIRETKQAAVYEV